MIQLLLIASTFIDCSGDITDQLMAAVNNCYDHSGSCVINIGEGTCGVGYVPLCPTVEIEGASEQHTWIKMTTSSTAFHVLPYGLCQEQGHPWVGTVRLSRMRITGIRASHDTFGVFAENHINLDRLFITDFTQGIRIVADVTASPPGNANLFTVSEVRVSGTDHAGAYIDGGDVNVGLISQLNIVSSSCRKASEFDHLGPCAGIVDDGFLGSVYLAPHVSDAGKGYIISHPTARHVLVGPYAETNQSPGDLAQNSNVIGGLSLWNGYGSVIQGNRSNGFRFQNNLDPSNVTEFIVGNQTGTGGVFYSAGSTGLNPGWPLRLKADAAAKTFKWDVANIPSPVAIQAVGNSSFSLGTLKLKSSLLFIGP